MNTLAPQVVKAVELEAEKSIREERKDAPLSHTIRANVEIQLDRLASEEQLTRTQLALGASLRTRASCSSIMSVVGKIAEGLEGIHHGYVATAEELSLQDCADTWGTQSFVYTPR